MVANRNWTEEDINILKELWGTKTIPQIAKKMGRSINAVKIKSTRLKLGAFKFNSEYLTVTQISRILNIDTHTILDRWIDKYNLKYKLVAPSGVLQFKYVNIDDLLEWLKNNQDKWNSTRLEEYGLGVEPQWLKEKRKTDVDIPKRKSYKWTKQEDQKLILYYKQGKLTYKQIGEKLNRSESAVDHRLSKLDIWGTGEYIGKKIDIAGD